eukprot:3044041-Amphidinium_carterae.1
MPVVAPAGQVEEPGPPAISSALANRLAELDNELGADDGRRVMHRPKEEDEPIVIPDDGNVENAGKSKPRRLQPRSRSRHRRRRSPSHESDSQDFQDAP